MEVQSQFIEMFYNEKYPLQKLKTHIDVIRGVSYKPVDIKEETSDSISVILRSNNISNGQINFDDVVYVDNKRVTTEQVLSKGDIVMCGSNGSKKLVGKAAMINTIPSYRTSFGAFCLGIRCKESILPEYLSVYFQTPKYREVIEFLGSGSNILNIKPEHIYNLKIPIPSLEDQKHFVTIAEQADKSKFVGFKSQFIEMFGNLKQDTPWSEVVTITNGKAYPEEYQDEGTYPICGSGGIMYYGEKKLCNGNTIILGRKGNINSPIFMESDYWIVDTAFSLDVYKEKLNPRFFYFWCCQYDFTKLNKQGVLPSLTRKDLEKVEMAVPPMGQQKQFVSIAEQADKSKLLHRTSIKYSKYSL